MRDCIPRQVLWTATREGAVEADWSGLERAVAPSGSSLPLPRLLVVLAHPDDEVLALGGRLERLASSRLLTITDGAPKDGSDARQHGFPTLEAYREARRDELGKALAHAGLGLGVTPVFGGQVPDQAASFHLVALARGIASAIEDFKPEVVLTHPYEGGHPDHDACAFAVHAAVRMFCGQGGRSLPIVEAPFYHAGADGGMRTGCFPEGHEAAWSVDFELGPEEQANKRARLSCFVSQAETLAQFDTARESYRLAPAYDFVRRPRVGQLLYERFPWGMQGNRFCGLASAALETLFGAGDEQRDKPNRA